MALQKKVHRRSGKETREAVPIPLEPCSLRFDDALHVIPEMLDMIGWAELATDLGFGMAGTKGRTAGEGQLVPARLAKRPRAIDTSQGEPKFSLLAQEAGEARKWGCASTG